MGIERLVAAGVVAGVVVFGACGPMPAPRDTLVVGSDAEPKSLDPQRSTALADFRIAAAIYEGLVRFRAGTLDLEPALAESWEVGDGGRTVEFRLRGGVRFHDGTDFNAEAVRFNFERILDPQHPYHHTGPFPLAFFFQQVDRIETPDARTVRFHLKEPFSPFLSNLAYPTGFIVSPGAVRKFGGDFGRHPCGTGPFAFEAWEARRAVRLAAYSGYREGPPNLARVIFQPIPDPNARTTALVAGACDAILDAPADLLGFFRTNPAFCVIQEAGPHLWFLILNTREGPFQHRAARLAANLAIDRKAITEDLLGGTATVPSGPIPEAFAWAAGESAPLPHDPHRARALIREAGLEGAQVTLYAAEGGSGMLEPRAMAAAIQADLAKAGLNVRIETFEWNTFLARVNRGLGGKADMAQMAWMVNDPDTLPFLALRSDATPEEGGFNSGYYSNPEIDRHIASARRTFDRAERARHYAEIQRLAREDPPWVFVAAWKQNAVVTANVRNFSLQPSFLLDLKTTRKVSR
jgi:peptide/nickel transport system substrate-binding protein